LYFSCGEIKKDKRLNILKISCFSNTNENEFKELNKLINSICKYPYEYGLDIKFKFYSFSFSDIHDMKNCINAISYNFKNLKIQHIK
jgi:hypothetical protein